MEDVAVTNSFWRGKRVFLTGHTGFKGSWLALYLQLLGAKVYGYALEPPTNPNLYTLANVETGMVHSEQADIRNAGLLRLALQAAQADIVFHLAAQALVRYSYEQPVETYSVNVMGTVNLLEAVRVTPSVRAVVNVTTDKCYENRMWVWAYRENEALGGFDPYSSSKACAELVTSAYRQSFLDAKGVFLASARAGNVIGGGDFAKDRLLPDFLRAIDANEALMIRSPLATRPWQHVLEPLSGYLMLAEKLYLNGSSFAEAWNFGPVDEDAHSVQWIVERLSELCNNVNWKCDNSPQPHEAHYLKLDSSKARQRLNWTAHWRLTTALQKTLEWHEAWRKNQDMRLFTLAQINNYLEE